MAQELNIILPSPTRTVQEEDFKGVYEIDGLYPGYGNTLGNSIRRILLSSLPGAAVTKIKVEGVNHEFSTMENVMEDVVMLLLNVKQLRFRMTSEGPEVATIDVKGAREIKGKDIKCPTQLEVLNRDHHIATLTNKNAHFIAELTVERGLGFVPAEHLTREKVPVGTMILDGVFSPIRRVNYEVENMRVGDRTDFNRLRLTIETDGSLTPHEALVKALEIMREQIERIATFGAAGHEHDEKTKEVSEEASQFSTLHISARVQNALIAAGITSPEMLSQKTSDELLMLEGVGEKAVSDIKKALAKEGLSLRESNE